MSKCRQGIGQSSGSKRFFYYLRWLDNKLFTGTFSSNSHLNVREVQAKSVRALLRYFGMKFLWLVMC